MNTTQFPTPADVKPDDAAIAVELQSIADQVKAGKRSFYIGAHIGVYIAEAIKARGWGVSQQQLGSELHLTLWIPRIATTPPS